MRIKKVMLKAQGEVENQTCEESELPSCGDGEFIDGVGYEVLAVMETPNLPCEAHVVLAETPVKG